jgi:hypothetical protein
MLLAEEVSRVIRASRGEPPAHEVEGKGSGRKRTEEEVCRERNGEERGDGLRACP